MPSPPDPVATANAQTASNQATAQYQQQLNMVSQDTPYGSTSYNQTGTASDGAPQYTATTSLSPDLQKLVDSGISNDQAISGIEGNLANSAGSELSTPLNLTGYTGPTALQNQMDKQSEATLDPQWAQLSQQNDQQLYDRGLAPGSQGYGQGMANFSNQRQQAYDTNWNANEGAAQNALASQEQAQLTDYNQPINELNALKSGAQVQQPGIGPTAAVPQTGVAGTNVAQIDQNAYQAQLNASSAAMGGLFGLASNGISGLTSSSAGNPSILSSLFAAA